MKALLIVVLILLALFGLLLVPFRIEGFLSLEECTVRLFGLRVWSRRGEKLYEFLAAKIEKSGTGGSAAGLIRPMLKAIRVRSLEFDLGVGDNAPVYALVTGFSAIVFSLLREASYRDAILIRYDGHRPFAFSLKISVRPVDLLVAFFEYRRRVRRDARQKG